MGTPLSLPTQINIDQGIATQYGLVLPPGANVAAYVRSTGVQPTDTGYLATNLVATLAAGLARVRAGFGDFVVVLPGHSELIIDATTISNAIQSGTRIVGVGTGTLKPTFTFNTTTASIAVSVANVLISGCLFLLDGINAVANAFNITGSDFQFVNNEVEVSTTAKAAVICMTLGTGASRANISGNVFRGLIASPVTNGILVSGALADVRIEDNELWFPSSTANGNINVTGVCTGLKIFRNFIGNSTAASVTALNFANVAIEGMAVENRLYCKNTGGIVSGTNVITFGAAVLMAFDDNLCSNDPRTSGLLMPTQDA